LRYTFRHGLWAVLCLPGLLFAGGSAFAAARGPALIPMPREVHASELVPVRSVAVIAASGDAEDSFSAEDLGEALAQRGLVVNPKAGSADLIVELLRVDTPAAKTMLQEAKQTFDAAMHDEGYVLLSKPGYMQVIAATGTGLFYGAQTVKQLVVREKGSTEIWSATIRDWPAMKYRGIHDDLSRGPIPTLAFQKHQIEVFAAYKINLYSPYFEHTLQYDGDPLAAPPGGSLTRAEARELAEFAARRHVVIVPEQEAFGHLHHVLKFERYSDLAETPHGHVIAPGQPGSQPLIKSWFTQIAEDFPGPFLHIGADETFELGTGRTKAEVDIRGLGPVYADFLTEIHTTLAPLHRRLLFWGDVAGTDKAAVKRLPKDMIAIPWIYWHEDDYDDNILPFKNAGMETWVAPGDSNWNVVYPHGDLALDNIQGFVEAGQRLGSTGVLTAVWNDDGEGLFNLDWYGVLFGAAAGWQPGKSNIDAYKAAFGATFYGDSTGKIDMAQSELMAAEKIDISDDAFWIDPWSKDGQAMSAKMRDRIPASRLHAEKALELIGQARRADSMLRESAVLDAMELGARRIDFIGMKFQLAEEMAESYATAYAIRNDPKRNTEARELLFSISSMNGRCQDLRDGYSELKNLYKSSWLAENRPYWLDNVLVRYDLRIQLWQRRGEEMEELADHWQNDGQLPAAGAAGIPEVTAKR
jgi:hexosaminidase